MMQTSNPDRVVATRRMDFGPTFEHVPKHFAGDEDVLVSHVMASLSSVFPDGEDFFVRSVRHFRDQITDPALKRQVSGFVGQEAVHGREHRAFNDRLEELGYPTKSYERFTQRALAFRERVTSPKACLAVTAALEHFTATLAELVLSSEETRELIGDPAVQNLFIWHALEESEHKAVAFDVYRAVGGSERTRVWTMNSIRVGFVVGMSVQIVLSMLGDKATYRRGVLGRSWRTFKKSPLANKELWAKLADYNRPDFHPDDFDTTELESTWRAELFGDEGTLNGQLVTSKSAA